MGKINVSSEHSDRFIKKYVGWIVLILVIIALILLFSLPRECRITDKQQEILNSEVPLNATARSEMMRAIESEMIFTDIFCINNPQQLLVRKFSAVSLG